MNKVSPNTRWQWNKNVVERRNGSRVAGDVSGLVLHYVRAQTEEGVEEVEVGAQGHIGSAGQDFPVLTRRPSSVPEDEVACLHVSNCWHES